ncbi:MAG TPA: hypothetical protein V6D23_28355, partial [Candidatus Obscuribacterales bacterium]
MKLRELMCSRQAASRILMDLVEILHQHDPRMSHLIPYLQDQPIDLHDSAHDSDSTSSGYKHPAE